MKTPTGWLDPVGAEESDMPHLRRMKVLSQINGGVSRGFSFSYTNLLYSNTPAHFFTR